MSPDELDIVVETEQIDFSVVKHPDIKITIDSPPDVITLIPPDELNILVETKEVRLDFDTEVPEIELTLNTLPDVIVLPTTGIPGPPGAEGARGPEGPRGERGVEGSVGPSGADSTVPGPQGEQGVPGSQGAQGIQGPQGIKGDTGAQGVAGPIGSAGSQIYAGIGVPSAVLGNIGDYYLDGETDIFYGPKQPPTGYTTGVPLQNQSLVPADTAAGAYTLGVKIKATVAGKYVTALRFYRAPTATTSSRTLKIWRVSTQAVVASAVVTESGTGWQEVALSTPLLLIQDEEYIITHESVGAGNGYRYTSASPVSTVAGVVFVGGGFYAIGTVYPATAQPNVNYFVDVDIAEATAVWPEVADFTGDTGAPGTPGEKWFSGPGGPQGATGIIGDWYLDTSVGNVYEKTGSEIWTQRGNIRGPQGIVGPQGIQGIQGIQGPTGLAEVWYSSAGVPAGALGVIGDWHLNTTNGDVSEKTGASTWTIRGNIKGPTGAQGIQGVPGPEGLGVDVYEQPAAPTPPIELGSIWIDTDENLPISELVPDAIGQDGKWLQAVGGNVSWMPMVSYGTSFPASPNNGQEHILVDSVTNPTYQWRFRYNASSTSPYKWEAVGVLPLTASVDPFGSCPAAGWQFAPAGPSLVLPRPGDYINAFGFHYGCSTGSFIHMRLSGANIPALDIGGWADAAANVIRCASRQDRVNGMTTGTITSEYYGGTNAQVARRWMSLTPVRVS